MISVYEERGWGCGVWGCWGGGWGGNDLFTKLGILTPTSACERERGRERERERERDHQVMCWDRLVEKWLQL